MTAKKGKHFMGEKALVSKVASDKLYIGTFIGIVYGATWEYIVGFPHSPPVSTIM